MKNKKIKLSLVVLNYNGKHLLKEYFDSVFKQSLLPDEIIMLDNASTDDSINFVKKKYPKVLVYKNSQNDGTAEGSNAAFRYAHGDYVLFQSNDLRLDKNCVKEIYKFITKNKKVGICTSVFVRYKKDAKGNIIVDNAGGDVDMYGFGMQRYPDVFLSKIPESEEVFFSYGSSFIISHELYKKLDGFDKRYFTLNDDIDLSWRVRRLGYTIWYTKKSIVWHRGSATLGPLFQRGKKWYWSERNALRTLLKDHDLRSLLKILPVYALIQTGELGYLLVRGKFTLLFASLKAVLWNLYYLPETLYLRNKIQKINKKNNIHKIMIKTSLKMKIFLHLYKYNLLNKSI